MRQLNGHRLVRRIQIALVLGTIALPLRAVEDPDPDFSLKDTIQAGPFHVAPFFVVKDFGYDSNTRLDSNKSEGDYTITFGPGARAVAPLGHRAAIALRDEIDYAVFASQKDLNHVNNSFRGKIHLYARNMTFYSDLLQDSYRERPSTEIDYRIRTTTTSGKFGFSWHRITRSRSDLYVRQTDYHYDSGQVDTAQAQAGGNSIVTTLERVETSIVMEERLRIRPRTTLLAEAQAGVINFQASSPQRDSTSFSSMLGLEFDPAGSIRGYVKAGRKHLSPDDNQVDGYSGLISDAALSARILGRGDLRFGFGRNTGFSVAGDNLFFIEVRRSLAYEHYISDRFSLEGGIQYSDVNYPLDIDQGTGDGPQHRADRIAAKSLTLRYRMGNGTRIGLAVTHWQRDSTFDSEDTARNTITTLMEFKP